MHRIIVRLFSSRLVRKKTSDWKFVEWNICVFLDSKHAASFLLVGRNDAFFGLDMGALPRETINFLRTRSPF